ncbi:MAG: tRNA (adenosine(37)-N6)-dimethylallyltransferase MiaA [Vicingus serpentipes]|nr:tRNA (adenosine(37)-N6)-dimethylallyltransferase MiaA [Vicingus serpentipes]
MTQKTLVVITGPTAVGKTVLCVKVAQHLNTEIISADSRQFYQELSIGTAKPTAEEMNGIPHHFIDSHSITEDFNANDFEKSALVLLDSLFKKHNIIILTGGSGLYIDALCDGFDEDIPEADDTIRKELEKLYQKHGISILQEKLNQLDPVFHKEVDLNNVKRLQRAIEVCVITKKPYSELRKGIKQKRPFNVLKIGLERDREELFSRINQRVDEMMQQGLLEEVKQISKYREHNALKTVGYTELFNYIDGKMELEEAIEKIKINTRRYAKRQLSWFHKHNDYKWFHPDDQKSIVTFIENSLKS